jgi:hypothetical protein
MPFKSKSQASYMFAAHPEIATEWAAKTPSIKSLPKKATAGLKSTKPKKPVPKVKKPKRPTVPQPK